MASLAKRMEGRALIGIEVLSWRAALMRLMPQAPGEFELRLAIAEILERDEKPASFAPLVDWLDGKAERMPRLARILSRLLSEAGFYGLESKKEWQQDLIRMLGYRHFSDQMLEESLLPDEVHLFCIDEMPKKAWNFFIGQKENVSIYHFSPCRMYWDDLYTDRERRNFARKWRNASNFEEFESYLKETHPLLANWGKVGRETIRLFDELESQEAYESEHGEKTLLYRLRQDLLDLETTGSVHVNPLDISMEIVAAGSSKLREVQILRDRLLSYFKKTNADPADVLVLAPDIKTYASLIQFVFGEEMPQRIAPIEGLASNHFAQGLLLFFELAGGRWDADQVLELFENRAFREKQSISAEDLELFRGWMQGARVRGGWDKKQGNWVDGLRRMLLGLAILLPGDEIRNLNLGQAERLDRFFQLVQRLQKLSEPFQSSLKRTLNEWATLLNELARSLFLPQEREQELLSSYLRKIYSAGEMFSESVFSWQLLRSLFVDACRSDADSYQAHLWQAVQFSSLQPGSIRPARAIFLLGMDGENFPRKQAAGSFDWECPSPEPGDVDRYLLLQALFAAKEQFSISYCHISPEDGKTVEMALPIQELLQTVDLFYSFKVPSEVYPALPFDRKAFEPKSRTPSYSLADYRAALQAPEAKPAPFWPRAEVDSRRRQLDLLDLAACAKNPWKYFLQKTMGIYLQKDPLFSELRSRDFELPVYVKRELLFASLDRPISELLKEKAHLLPPGAIGEGTRAQLEVTSREWQESMRKWGIDPKEIHSIRFSPRCKATRTLKEGWIEAPALQIDSDVEIIGDLKAVAPSGLLLESSGSKLSLALRHWPLLHVYLLHSGQKSGRLYSLHTGSSSLFEIDPFSALRRWIDYFFRAEKSLSPLIQPWAESFLRADFSDWSQKAHELLSREEDRWIRWVASRAAPCPLESIWEEWSAFSRETFAELI